MTSLQLDADTWDIGLDDGGNLALASGHQAIVQDVCSAVQTWLGEVLYGIDMGVPYGDDLMSGQGAIAFYAADAEVAAKTVPGVASATCYRLALGKNRLLTGIIAVTMTDGETEYVAF